MLENNIGTVSVRHIYDDEDNAANDDELIADNDDGAIFVPDKDMVAKYNERVMQNANGTFEFPRVMIFHKNVSLM